MDDRLTDAEWLAENLLGWEFQWREMPWGGRYRVWHDARGVPRAVPSPFWEFAGLVFSAMRFHESKPKWIRIENVWDLTPDDILDAARTCLQGLPECRPEGDAVQGQDGAVWERGKEEDR